MQLAYDFDMFSLIPDSVQSDFQSQFNALGVSAQMSGQIALFRDERTAAALKSADETVRQFFIDAGFGMNVYSSGAPAGRYLARDETGRLERLAKLATLMMERADDLRAANWGEFSFGDFMRSIQAASPIDEVEVKALHMAALTQRRRGKAMTKLGLMTGLGLIAFSATYLVN